MVVFGYMLYDLYATYSTTFYWEPETTIDDVFVYIQRAETSHQVTEKSSGAPPEHQQEIAGR